MSNTLDNLQIRGWALESYIWRCTVQYLSRATRMPPHQGTKRKNGEEVAVRDKKKQKVDFARNIVVQSSSAVGGGGHGIVKGVSSSLNFITKY